MADEKRTGPPVAAGQNLAEGSKPTPTQEENDLAAMGEHVINKEPDGSPPDPGLPQPPEPEPVIPVIDSIAPTSALLPDVNLTVTGQNFTDSSVILFDGSPQTTTLATPTELTTSIVGFAGAAGPYDVLVRDAAGDSNVVQFTFTAASDEEAERGQRRRRPT